MLFHSASLPILHIFYAILVSFIWGTNFVAVHYAYEMFTPCMLLTLRFLMCVIPWVFFVPKPSMPWKDVAIFALLFWVAQFSFLFIGIYLGAPSGLASLVMQTQIFFTLFLSIMLMAYKPKSIEILGVFLAFFGVVLVGFERFAYGNWVSLSLMIPSALSVSMANIFLRTHGKTDDNPLSLIIWSSLIPPIPFFIGSLIFESPFDMIEKFSFKAVGALCYTVYFSTVLAASLWAFLMRQYNPSQIVPFSLLIPVFGMGSAWLMLGETYSVYTWVASGLIMVGLVLNQLSHRMSFKVIQQV